MFQGARNRKKNLVRQQLSHKKFPETYYRYSQDIFFIFGDDLQRPRIESEVLPIQQGRFVLFW